MKKIAVCLRGDFRNWELNHDTYMKLFEKYDCDFFLSTWTHTMYEQKFDCSDNSRKSVRYHIPLNIDFLLNSFDGRLVSHKIINHANRHHYSGKNIVDQFQLCYFSNLLKSREEALRGKSYDVCINMRPDFSFDTWQFQACLDKYLADPNFRRSNLINPTPIGRIDQNALMQDWFFLAESHTIDIFLAELFQISFLEKNMQFPIISDPHYRTLRAATQTGIIVNFPRNVLIQRRINDNIIKDKVEEEFLSFRGTQQNNNIWYGWKND